MDTSELLTYLPSLFISLVSLIISIVALVLSKKVYYLSSKDYYPEIDFSFEDDRIEVLNKSSDIFKVTSINMLKLDTFGFEDYKTRKINEFHFVTKSRIFDFFGKNDKKIRISFDSSGACAYLCPYDEILIQHVEDKISKEYSLGSKKGYALPSIRSVCYMIEIRYKNKFLEHKSINFKYKHYHGHGYEKFKITTEEFIQILESANVPKFEHFSDLWKFLIDRNNTKNRFMEFPQ